MAPDVDERRSAARVAARAMPRRLADAKAEAVRAKLAEPAYVLAADTVVACGRRILPKADDRGRGAVPVWRC